ncbi:NAD(P)H-dependent glycerol-3-phosphate dehydrogenase [Tindallia californiensis]|uniref:Glycerol-3-phosphate dehydrogenase [NAD(P)+] n=1 Tax=Tindallia californiensis TaxID=159292 RepID=A0A1H3JPP1_9FIRM|nr:NAD(P)H-dependent glycerol-3-phosphate dehydrogenase [Tindallia californiensis]SDY41569.1 glycerol 3-phosphate dehydrogenase (NAD(P)+) [Tindallia californiensis]
MNSYQVTILGAGSWGTALATVLNKNGHNVKLWMRNEDQKENILKNRVNHAYLPDVLLSEKICPETNIKKALKNAEVIIIAIPTQQIREVLRENKSLFPENALIINVSKGIEKNTYFTISQIIKEELGSYDFCVVSGPSHAEEVAMKLPTTLVAASSRRILAEKAQNMLMNEYLRVYTNPDVTGVELAGALKNVIAFGAGVIDGIGYGDNAKAALMTRGITEMARLGSVMGSSLNTFAGLSGIGDLIVTCTSMHSRNRRAGILVGQGKSMNEALEEVGMVVEGVSTAQAVYELGKKYQIDLPITSAIYQVLYENKNVEEAVLHLMTRSKKNEMEEIVEYRPVEWDV